MYRQSEKNLLSSNMSSTCPHNMVNFGPLAAEIVSLVWGTPGNFNGFRVLGALLHVTLAVGVSQTAALNRGRHLYSAGRPSRWALAHILVFLYFNCHGYWHWKPAYSVRALKSALLSCKRKTRGVRFSGWFSLEFFRWFDAVRWVDR